jgi:RNA polymerase sigma-70 factor, ECF subfamily
MNKDRDAALVKDCKLGNRQAMSKLVSKYQKPVFNAAYRILGNSDDAADITQTVFLKVFEHIDDYNPKFKFFSWVYRITINESLNQVKKQRQQEPLAGSEVSTWQSPAQSLESKTLYDRVQMALMSLNIEYRTVVIMKHLSGFSYQQISEILQLPEKTVKSRLYTARQSMKKMLCTQMSKDQAQERP